MHARLRTATLRHDADGQATLLNLLLRNYLHYSLYDQAEKLVSKSVFPEQANNNEWARYLYYTGKRGSPPTTQEMAQAPRCRLSRVGPCGTDGTHPDRHMRDQVTAWACTWDNLQITRQARDGSIPKPGCLPKEGCSGHGGLQHSPDPLPSCTPGRIKAIQLEYSEARRTMTNALRKAPQHTAVGFKQTVSHD